MARSPFIDSYVMSPKHSGKRTHKVQAFVIHHMAAVWTGKRCAEYLRDTPSREASANYYIGFDGDVAMSVEEENRAWTSSSAWADNRAITYELSNSAMGYPWPVSPTTINKAILMLAEQHKRYGLRASYTGDTSGTLWRHDWFTETNCPGPSLGGMFSYIADEVNKILDEKPVVESAQVSRPVAKPVAKPKEKTGGVIKMSGTFQAQEEIIVRDKPSTSGRHVATYYAGENVKYDRIHFTNGYAWLEYKRATGGKAYIPIAPVKEVWGTLK